MISVHPVGAVGGGADGVGDADTTLARDAGDDAGIDTGDPGNEGLDTVASSLAVGRGFRGAVEALHPVAATGGQRPLAGGVGDAWAQVRRDLAACDGLGNMRCGDEEEGQRKNQESTGARHGRSHADSKS
ncbi:unnamed protein product, partial [Musa acuminata subsp. burmannicoides]